MNQNIDYIGLGLQQGLIRLDEDKKAITYLHQNRKKNYTNPEEKVQVLTYLKLILHYGYKPDRIRLYVPVTMGVETKEADIIVYNDDECEEPHILVECKKEDISEQEFTQAISQAYSYAYALPNEVKYIWVVAGLREEFYSVNTKKATRIKESDIPQYGVKRLANYKFVYDAESLKSEAGKQKLSDLTVVTEDELTKQFKKAHDALWAGGQLNPSEAFDELDKLIFCKIWDERKDRKAGDPYDFQIITVDKEEIKGWSKLSEKQLEEAIAKEQNKRLSKRVKTLYEEGRKKDPEVFRDDIRLTDERIATVVEHLQKINLGETDLDSKGRAFETFMDSFFRGSFGQYFTPRPIVKFSTDVLPITKDSFVLDTSCGSGGFLLYALNKIRDQATEIYPNFRTDNKQGQRHYKYWHDFAQNNLFGIEINEQISRAAKMNMIIHDDGHTNVISADGLLNEKEIQKLTQNRGFKYNQFNFIITNPPFGSTIKSKEKSYLHEYGFGNKLPDWLDIKAKSIPTPRENQSTEILFIEQCYRFLCEGGYLAIVLPDGVLTNSSLQYVRDGIEDMFRIVAVVSMPQTAFTATGAGVKSSVLFLKKYPLQHTEKLKAEKLKLQAKIKDKFEYKQTLERWEEEKKQVLKDLEGFDNPFIDLSMTEIKKTEEYKEWRDKVNSEYTERVNNLKEELQDAYLKAKQEELPDYPIFMAIAEGIGYDATGKKTNNNELDYISEELTKFIEAIENGAI